MKTRCYAPSNNRFYRYGSRGITVCDAWINSFETFLIDMGLCPPKMQLDRINNDLNYSPTNCRWVTSKENSRNRSTNRFLTIDGITKSHAEWCEIFNISQKTLHSRISRNWPEHQWFIPPINYGYTRENKILH